MAPGRWRPAEADNVLKGRRRIDEHRDGLKTGRDGLTPDDLSALRALDQAHTPAVIQKAITESVARFTRRGDDPRGVTFRYVWDSLRRFATRKAPATHPARARPLYPPGLTRLSDAMATLAMASRQVRRIVRLEARANRLLVRWDRARRRAMRAKAQAYALFDEVTGLEHALTDAAARRAPSRPGRGLGCRRARPGGPSTTPSRPRPPMSPTTPSPRSERRPTMDDHRPHKVQKILQLEGKAATSRAAYESTLARITPAKHKAQQYDQEAKALKVTLTPYELSELRRARSGV